MIIFNDMYGDPTEIKTRFKLVMDLRIAKDDSGNDKFSNQSIVNALERGNAQITDGRFVTLKTNNNQIMAEIEGVYC